LIARLDQVDRQAARVLAGPVTLAELSDIYQVSATNLKRMFKKAETDGLLGWEHPRRRGSLWLSHGFLEDYFTWQSAKFAALALAYDQACLELGLGTHTAVVAA
jgi:AraC-like DNA-binding protein